MQQLATSFFNSFNSFKDCDLLTIRLAFSLPGRHSKGIPTDSSRRYDGCWWSTGASGSKKPPDPNRWDSTPFHDVWRFFRGDLHFKSLTFSEKLRKNDIKSSWFHQMINLSCSVHHMTPVFDASSFSTGFSKGGSLLRSTSCPLRRRLSKRNS